MSNIDGSTGASEPPVDAGVQAYTTSDIVVLTELEALRRRPGMYIGSVGPEGQRRAVGLALRWAIAHHVMGHASRLDVEQPSGGR
ncbi:MAG: DNA topoisomerase IV subunit B, partial [Myxococcota bacterium]